MNDGPHENTILIADDEASVRELVQSMVASEGYEAVLCEDGGEALSYLKQFTPEFIIVDATMPVMNGLSICDRVKRVARLREVPVIITADKRDNKMMGAVRYVKADGFLEKPVDATKLLENLRILKAGQVTELNYDDALHATLASSLL